MIYKEIDLDLGVIGIHGADVGFDYYKAEKETLLEPGCDAHYDIQSVFLPSLKIDLMPLLNEESFKTIIDKLEYIRNE